MKQTPEDLAFFRDFSRSQMGTYFADYLKRVIDYAHDSRSWGKDTTRESAELAARLIKESVLDRIRPPSKTDGTRSDYE